MFRYLLINQLGLNVVLSLIHHKTEAIFLFSNAFTWTIKKEGGNSLLVLNSSWLLKEL